MEHEGFYFLGYIPRTHGVQGRVVIKLESDDPARYKKLKSLFIESGTELMEYPVSSVSVSGDQAIVALEGVTDMDMATAFLRKQVFLPLAFLPDPGNKKLYLHEAQGMEVIDKSLGSLGVISAVYDLPEQPVAGIMVNGKEVLFPLIGQFIVKVDRVSKQLHVDLPEGLVDIYLNQ
jgi:16S rRNA processing protein RimM